MTTQLYHLPTQTLDPRRWAGGFTVDGKPCDYDGEFVQLRVIESPDPASLAADERMVQLSWPADAARMLDLTAKTVRHWWVETFVPEVPPRWRVSRDSIWNRVKAAVGQEVAIGFLSALPEPVRLEFLANEWFWSDNAEVRQLIASVPCEVEGVPGFLNPDEILAPE